MAAAAAAAAARAARRAAQGAREEPLDQYGESGNGSVTYLKERVESLECAHVSSK